MVTNINVFTSDLSNFLEYNCSYVPFPFQKPIFKRTSVANFRGEKTINQVCLSVEQPSG